MSEDVVGGILLLGAWVAYLVFLAYIIRMSR